MPVRSFIARYPRVLASAWAAVIFLLCAMPGRYVPGAWWLELLSADKLVHFFVFFVLGMLVFLALDRRGAPARFFWLGMIVLYGVMLEIMQATVFAERSAEFADMIANSLGAIVAFAASRRMSAYFNATLANR